MAHSDSWLRFFKIPEGLNRSQRSLVVVSQTVNVFAPGDKHLRLSFKADTSSLGDAKNVYLDPRLLTDTALTEGALYDVLCGQALFGSEAKNVVSPNVYARSQAEDTHKAVRAMYVATEVHTVDQSISRQMPGFGPYIRSKTDYVFNPEAFASIEDALSLPKPNAAVAAALITHELLDSGAHPLRHAAYDDVVSEMVGRLVACGSSVKRLAQARIIWDELQILFPDDPEEQEQPGDSGKSSKKGDKDQQPEGDSQDSPGAQSGDQGSDTKDQGEDEELRDPFEDSDPGDDPAGAGQGGQDKKQDEQTGEDKSGSGDQEEPEEDSDGGDGSGDDKQDDSGEDAKDGDGAAGKGAGDQSDQKADEALSSADTMAANVMRMAAGDDAGVADDRGESPVVYDRSEIPVGEVEPPRGWPDRADAKVDVHVVNVRSRPQDHAAYAEIALAVRAQSSALRNKLSFHADTYTEYSYGHRSGDLDEGCLEKLVIDRRDPHPTVFCKKDSIKHEPILLGLLVDESGSMMERVSPGEDHRCKIDEARDLVVMLVEGLAPVATMPLCVYGHSGSTSCDVRRYYSPHSGDRCSLAQITHREQNYDGFAIDFCTKDMERTMPNAARRILVVLSDGRPMGHGYSGSSAHAHVYKKVQEARRRGTEVYGVGVANAFTRDVADALYGPGGCVILPDVASAALHVGAFFVRIAKRALK